MAPACSNKWCYTLLGCPINLHLVHAELKHQIHWCATHIIASENLFSPSVDILLVNHRELHCPFGLTDVISYVINCWVVSPVIGVGKVACGHVVVHMILQQVLYLHWACYACMHKLVTPSVEAPLFLCWVAFVMCFVHRQVYVIFVGNLYPLLLLQGLFQRFHDLFPDFACPFLEDMRECTLYSG